jgi:hypothetical protein
MYLPIYVIIYLSVPFIYVSWLRHYATSRKVAGLIPDEVIGFLN